MDAGFDAVGYVYDEPGNRERIRALGNLGVEVWGAERVYVGPEVELGKIEPGAVLLNAVIRGSDTAIGCQSKIGISGIALLVNAQVGRQVELGAGSYQHATLFDRVKVRGFAEMRTGTVLEEEAEVGHNVGLKHTFFTTGVVAGSCINFCDVVVSGGSSRKDHSEIGSGAVHFNFDPRGDKFGSLIGDVTGLLLRKKRVFIGGNSGVVAPAHIGFGAVVAAGSYVRGDVEESRIYRGGAAYGPTSVTLFDKDIYHNLERKFLTTAELCGNLRALELWYQHLRIPVAKGLERKLCEAARRNIRTHLEHRVEQLDKVAWKVSALAAKGERRPNPFHIQHLLIGERREDIRSLLLQPPENGVLPPAGFVQEYQRAHVSNGHCAAIHGISEAGVREAEEWLLRIASQPKTELQKMLRPSLQGKQ